MSDDLFFIQGDQVINTINFNNGSYTRGDNNNPYENSKFVATSDERQNYFIAPETTKLGDAAWSGNNYVQIALTKQFSVGSQKRVGTWFDMASTDSLAPLNRFVTHINPFRARMQEGVTTLLNPSFTGMTIKSFFKLMLDKVLFLLLM